MDTGKEKMKLLAKALPWLVFSLFSFLLIGNNFHAKLGMVDDHEIKLYLGDDNSLSFLELPNTIWSTEVGKWGNTPRYRPTYYGLRITETFLWGDNPVLWYGFRYAILVISMYLCWAALSKYVPSITAYMFIFYIMTGKYWSDIFARLGPAETYALLSSSILAYGISMRNFWLVILGYVLTVGAKENLISLFPIFATWIVLNYKELKSNRSYIVGVVIAIIVTVIVGANVYIYASTNTADIYGNSIGFKDRIIDFVENFKLEIRKYHLKFPIILTLMAFFQQILYKLLFKLKLTSSKIWLKILSMGLIGIVICSQYLFYNNQIPTNSRYDFPVMILIPLLTLLTASILSDYFEIMTSNIYLIYTITLLRTINLQNYYYINSQSQRNAIQSEQFDHELRSIINNIKNNTWPLVMVSDNSGDYEPLVSLSRYLFASDIQNTLMIKFIPDPKLDNVLGNMLQARIVKVMNEGSDKKYDFEHFVKYDVSEPSCYAITFRDSAKYTRCDIVGNFK